MRALALVALLVPSAVWAGVPPGYSLCSIEGPQSYCVAPARSLLIYGSDAAAAFTAPISVAAGSSTLCWYTERGDPAPATGKSCYLKDDPEGDPDAPYTLDQLTASNFAVYALLCVLAALGFQAGAKR